jgi:hypothetical protein
MSSLLEDVNELLNKNYGDRGRLLHIKKTIEKNKILYMSDRQFLNDLCKKYLDQKSPEHKNQQQVKYSEKSDDMLYSENKNISGNNETASNIPIKQENKIFCIMCGQQMLESTQFCTNCGQSPNAISQTTVSHNQQYSSQSTQSAGRIWYLLPLFFGLFGGIIAWAIIRKRNSKRARNILILGIIFGIIQYGVYGSLVMLSMFSGFDGSSEIDDALSGLPEQIQNIKRGQILNCENNMGYLQSFELGEIIKDRCINGILGK